MRAARVAAQYGARVGLFEAYRLGGTCVIRGCVPKKLMVYASRFAIEFAEAEGFGWTLDAPRFDWGKLKTNRDQEVARLESIYRRNLLQAGVEIFQARAQLAGPNEVMTDQGDHYRAKTILIATGAKPVIDRSIEGHDLCIDSNDFFMLEQHPKRVIVQGAGYIGLEFACVLKHLGSEVQVLYRADKVLRGFDAELQSQLEQELRQSGLDLKAETKIVKIEQSAQGLNVLLDCGSIAEVDAVIKAIGRSPQTEDLGLQSVGITLDEQGAIPVDPYSRTVVPNIYAVGDVTNRVNLTPMAIREGQAFADTVFGQKDVVVDHRLVPTAVFTTPELATVGLTEEDALRDYPRLDVYTTQFRPMKSSLSGHHTKMFMKLLVDRDTDRVLGFHAIGPDTGEMAQLMGVALQMRASKSALDATLAVHPTAAEEIVTMRHPTRRYPVSAD